MVGYAYSFDYICGYSSIFIKAYACDDLSFVTPVTPSISYRVHRSSIKAEVVSDERNGGFFYLSLRHITKILELISIEEAENNYPVVMSWSITPSDRLLKRKASDFYSVWPVPAKLISNGKTYINITELCFKKPPSELELSFTRNVLNSAVYLCGLYMSEPFLVCGSGIFCSLDLAGAELKAYGSDVLYSLVPETCRVKKKKQKLSIRKVICRAEEYEAAQSSYGKDVSQWIVNIKRECISAVIFLIAQSLKKRKSFMWLLSRVKYEIYKSLDILMSLGEELISRSTVQSSSDIKKLSFDELLMAFTFADSMRDVTKNIRLSKIRRTAINKLVAPECIHNGRFYYKEKNYEN